MVIESPQSFHTTGSWNSQAWAEILATEKFERTWSIINITFLFPMFFSWVKNALLFSQLFLELNLVISGENSRLYHSFKTEDWVGRLSNLAVQCSKNHVEQVVLGRYYMGSLRLHQNLFELFCLVLSFVWRSNLRF